MHGVASIAQPDLLTPGRPLRESRREPALRVLTLTSFYPTNSGDATGCFVAEPLRRIEEYGINSCVLAVEPFHRSTLGPKGIVPGVTWSRYASIPGGIGLASAGAFLYASLISKLRKLHRSQPIDLIHAHAALPCGHAAMLLSRELKIPYAVTVHGLDAFFDKQVRGLAGAWCKRVTRFVYGSASRVLCISEKVAQRVIEGTTTHLKTGVIYNGVDPEMFLPTPTDSTLTTILSVGNLIPIKGHELLLQALAAILPRYPQLSWEIIGEGPERNRLTRLANDFDIAGQVRFLGRQNRNQVADAMRRCVLFALPSSYEGLGCVYLEAMSSERPVIACRGQGIDEIIRHGNNGWLIDPGNLQQLITALETLLQNAKLRQQIGQAARHTILQSFTSAHQAAQLASVYRECLA